MRFEPTNGLPPQGQGPFVVKFRSGHVSGPYTTAQLRWSDTGDDWDVVAVQGAAEDAPKDGRQANGAYE